MPRVVRDSDEEIEIKSSIRRTRASVAANITDSPLRRNTRSNKQLSTIESSPESLDESNVQSIGRTTRSRIATLDKVMAATMVKNLRSRKTSGSSDVSESIEVESETIEKRITRGNKTALSNTGTPTKTNLRSRSIRAGSEAKSTPPPSRNKRVTRSSSVDPVTNVNESSGTPIKRRTRASIVPKEPTVTEDEEIKNKSGKSLENTVVEITEDDFDNSVIFGKEKSNKISSNIASDSNKENSVKESFDNSKKFTLDSAKKYEESLTYNNSNETIDESVNKSFVTLPVNRELESSNLKINTNPIDNETDIEISNSLECQNSETKQNDVSLLNNQHKLNISENNEIIFDNSFNVNDDENEHIDVEEFTESSSTDESIIQVDNFESNKSVVDHNHLNIKNSYVKLNRTEIDKLVNQKVDENVEIDNDISNNINVDTVIKNVKTPIVLVNDCVKNNQNISKELDNTNISSPEHLQINIENSNDLEVGVINNYDKNLNSLCIDDESNDVVFVSTIKTETEKSIEFDNHDEIKTHIRINNSDDESENSTTINKNPISPESFIIKNESNDVEINSDSVNKDSEIEKPILVNENESSNSISVNNDEAENGILVNKNISLSENTEILNENKNEIECLIIKNNEKDEFVNSIVKESDNVEYCCRDVNLLKDETEILSSEHENREETKNASDSIESVELVNNYNETDLIIKNHGNESNDSISLPTKLNISFGEDNESKDSNSTNPINNKICSSDNVNDNTECASFVNKCTNEMEIDQKFAEPIPENSINNINNNAILDSTELSISDETDTDSKQSKIYGVDKNSVSSAVTDADGENASTPTKVEESNELKKQDKKQTRNSHRLRSKADDSDSNDSAENLFRDIPADEWLNETKPITSSSAENFNDNQNKSETDANNSSTNTKDTSILKPLIIQEDDNSRISNTRKSLGEKEQLHQKPNEEVTNQKANESLSKKARKSLEKKRESNQFIDLENSKSKDISGIQEAKKIVTEDKINSDTDENKSPNKSRHSIDKSLKLNHSAHEQHTDENSFKKCRRSLDISLHLNQSSFEQNKNKSISEKLRLSLNKSKMLNESTTEDNNDNSLDEEMEVDRQSDDESESPETDNKYFNENRELNTSQISRLILKNKRKSEKFSTSLNNSETSKHSSTSSFNTSLVKDQNEEDESNDEFINVEDCENNKSKSEENNDKSEKKNRKSLNKYSLTSQFNYSNSLEKNESLIEKMSDSLNNSNKSKHRLSLNKLNQSRQLNQSDSQEKNESLIKNLTNALNNTNKSNNRLSEKIQSPNESSSKSLIKDKNLNSESDNEIEVEDDSENSPLHVKNEVSSKNKDKLVKKLSVRPSIIDSESEEEVSLELKEECKQKSDQSIKSDNESPNLSTKIKNRKSINNTSIKSVLTSSEKDSTMENANNTDDFSNNSSSDKNKEVTVNQNSDENELGVNKSVEKCKERSKFINPTKQNLSNTIRVESSSENEVPEYKLEITDSEESENSEDNEESSSDKELDSDIDKEYNLKGKTIKKYSDDDVRGDVCRASEEEFSDSDDDGEDLSDFIVSDDKVEDSEDESESENYNIESDEDDNESEENDNENEEVDDENEEDDNESINSEDDEDANQIKTAELKLKKNESLNQSKSAKDKSANFSKSKKIESNSSKSNKSNSDDSGLQYSKNLNSDTEDEKLTNNVMSNKHKLMSLESESSESESEEGEDSYQVITVNPRDTNYSNLSSSKTKKITPLIECSTPKPGVTKKNDFSKGPDSFVDRQSLPNASNKSNSTRQKSESLNDLSDTKMVSSRLSIAEMPSKSIHDSSAKFKESMEMVKSPEDVIKNRQAWKLIPLNQTVHSLNAETPLTKYLKKSKLNDSAPGLERGKSDYDNLDILPNKNTLVNKKSMKNLKNIKESDDEPIELPVNKKSKKRKLQDISNPNSLNDDSIPRVAKKKKRAHIEESVIEEAFKWKVEDNESEEVQVKKKKKKAHKDIQVQENVEDVDESNIIENLQLTKKKKKKKLAEAKIYECLDSSQNSEEKQAKKKKKEKKALNSEENLENQTLSSIEEIKHKKKKMHLDKEEFNQEKNLEPERKSKLSSDSESHQKRKKSKRKNRESSDDKEDQEVEVSVNVDLDKVRPSALTTIHREVENSRAGNQQHKKKQTVLTKEKSSLKRLSDDVLHSLTDEPVKKSHKRQKLSNDPEPEISVPSTSMFSPGKRAPVNLVVDDGYLPLNVKGSTTEFSVVNLEKVKRISKKTTAVLNFRERMLSRNPRQPTSVYLMHLKKQKCKNSL